jgi:hypothetical protein
MRTALFTGAGASKAIGYPLTKELLPNLRKALRTRRLFSNASDKGVREAQCAELEGYLHGLMPGFEKAPEKELPLITDVFSLVEYAIASGESFAFGDDRTLLRCRDLLKHAIAEVFHKEFRVDYNTRIAAQRKQKSVLSKLTAWIKAQGNRIGLVTTNYDIGIEYELGIAARKPSAVDIGFDWRHPDSGLEYTRPWRPDFRIYKLHGSFDLLRCRTCGYVYFNPWGWIAHQAMRDSLDYNNTCHCRKDLRLELQIVSPSLVRDVRDANLLSIWRSAFEWMRNAGRWVIVGYSLPPEDLAIRSLLLRAYTTAKKKPEITVVQHGEAARPAYKLLFPKCTYRCDGLEGFLKVR